MENSILQKTTLSSDIFVRASVIGKTIDLLVRDKNAKILDVGGYQGNLGAFVNKQVTILDVFDVKGKNYVKGDARKLNFPDNYFDGVVCIEVLEHIKKEDRLKVISELVRVSKDLIILACPVYTEEIAKVEKFATNFFKDRIGTAHPWLREHEEYGLPRESQIYKELSEKVKSLQILGNHPAFHWLEMILLHFLDVATKEELSTQIGQLYSEFNRNLASKKPSGPVYRKIFVARKKREINVNLMDKVYGSKPSFLEKWRLNYEFTKFFLKYLPATTNINPYIFINRLKKLARDIGSREESLFFSFSLKLIKIIPYFNYLRPSYFTSGAKKFYSILWDFFFSFGLIVNKPFKGYPIRLLKVLLPENIKKVIRLEYSRSQVLKGVEGLNASYQDLYLRFYKSSNCKETIDSLVYKPKISILMPVYNTDKSWLEKAIQSVANQSYQNWELCIADDCSNKPETLKILNYFKDRDKRIKIIFRTERGDISQATNDALKESSGEFIGLLDHDDELTEDALLEVVLALNKEKDLDMIYSDEDKIDHEGGRRDPYFKPDWSPDMILSNMYTPHFSVYRKAIVEKIGAFRIGFEGSQDYDLALRFSEVTDKIYHIPKVLYHWRKIPGSTAEVYGAKGYAHESAKKALEEVIKRRKLDAKLDPGLKPNLFRVHYNIKNKEKVSIIISTKDKAELLQKCVGSVLKKTIYNNYEIIIVDNNSVENKTLSYFQKIVNNPRIKVLKYPKLFNFAAINNYAANKTKGKYLLFLNNDTEVIEPDWLASMIEHAQRNQVGVVGAKLLYPGGYIQHAGVILGIGGIAGHAQKMYPDNIGGTLPIYNNKDMIRNWSCVTAACMLVRRDVFEKVKGFDEAFRVAYNDVDFCLRVRKIGYLVVYTPYAKLFHYESTSVGIPGGGSRDLEEFLEENELMKKRWGDILQNDPYYNPNLTLQREDYSLRVSDS